MINRTINKKIAIIFIIIMIAITLFIILFPIYWLISLSFKLPVDAFSIPPKLLFNPTFSHFQEIWNDGDFQSAFLNSLIIAFSSVALSLLIGVPAAYALSRHKFKFRRTFLLGILTTRLIPPMIFVIPYFIGFKFLGLLDTRIGLMLIYTQFNLAMVVWGMWTYFDEIPIALEESARIDGASIFQGFYKIVLPLSAPGTAATGVLCFLLAWNEFLYALLLTDIKARTLPIAILNFIAYEGANWGKVAAGAVFLMIPVVIFGVLFRRFLAAGLMGGGIKG